MNLRCLYCILLMWTLFLGTQIPQAYIPQEVTMRHGDCKGCQGNESLVRGRWYNRDIKSHLMCHVGVKKRIGYVSALVIPVSLPLSFLCLCPCHSCVSALVIPVSLPMSSLWLDSLVTEAIPDCIGTSSFSSPRRQLLWHSNHIFQSELWECTCGQDSGPWDGLSLK